MDNKEIIIFHNKEVFHNQGNFSHSKRFSTIKKIFLNQGNFSQPRKFFASKDIFDNQENFPKSRKFPMIEKSSIVTEISHKTSFIIMKVFHMQNLFPLAKILHPHNTENF